MSLPYVPPDDPAAPRMTPAVLWLIAINVAVFFVQLTVQQDLPLTLGFQADGFDAGQLWTVGTYMFVHAGFWHLAFNMYTLWLFGPRLERVWSAAGLTRYYLWCGLGALVAHALLFPAGLLVGASGAIFGLMYAYARRWPDEEVLFFGVVPMKVRQMVLGLILVNVALGALSATGGGGDRVAYVAHLGGVAFGMLWFLRPTGPAVERVRQRVAAAPDVGDDPPRPVPKSFPRPRERGSETDEVVEKSKAITAKPQPARPAAPVRPAPAPAAVSRVAALDLVLDKISSEGIDSLTPDERQLLEETSRKLRDR